MKAGDVVLIPFPFTDLSGTKTRPAVIIIESETDIIVSFLTTKLKWKKDFDLIVEPTKENGLKRTSIIRLDKITTIDKSVVLGLLGSITGNQK